MSEQKKIAYFAGGCFWCITPPLRQVPGVLRVTSGYAGGDEANPSYEDVKYQRTGHRETIRIEYDPAAVDYTALVDAFLGAVDPFDGEGQFIDRGHSYTLAIYYTDLAEKEIARKALEALGAASGKKVWVALEPHKTFYKATEDHQDYDLKNPEAFRKELVESGRMKEEE